MIGIDTSLSILQNLNKYDKNIYVPNILKESLKNNILGFKNKNYSNFKYLALNFLYISLYLLDNLFEIFLPKGKHFYQFWYFYI